MTKYIKSKSGFGTVSIISVIFALLVFLAGGYFTYQYQKIKNLSRPSEKLAPPSVSKLASPKTEPASFQIDTSNWKTYRNEKYGFEVKYPPSTGAVNYVVDDNCVRARGTVDGVDIGQSQPPSLLTKRICINRGETYSDAMPSISDFWVRIYRNPSYFSLINWLRQNYLDFGAHERKDIMIGENSTSVFGDYPWQVNNQKLEQWSGKRSSSATEEEWLKNQPNPGIPRIFLIAPNKDRVYSITFYPYNLEWDLVLSTFHFIK